MRSSFEAIQLYAIVSYEKMKEHGVDKVLRSFFKDIKTLEEEGITIDINGADVNFKGTLILCLGDNPAQCSMGGFKQSVSALKPCRSCDVDSESWKESFKEDPSRLRELEEHKRQVAVVTDPSLTKEQRNNWTKEYGVNGAGELLHLKYFDVTKCLPHDPMHVLLEGIVPAAIKQLLRKYILEDQLFSLEQFNDRLRNFNFGYFADNTPALIDKDHLKPEKHVKQTASQVLGLAHTIPLILQEWSNDEYFDPEPLKNHIQLLQIMNLTFAYEISPLSVKLLERIIEVYCHRFKALYPNTVVPKFHFLSHIPGHIRRFGPGRGIWCMRFEALHAYFKNLVSIVRNFINLSYTLSYRRQVKQAARLGMQSKSKGFLYSGDEIVSKGIKALSDVKNSEALRAFVPENEWAECMIEVCSQVKRFGTTYKLRDIIMLECEEDTLPVFGRIIQLVKTDQNILVSYNVLETRYYCDQLNAYCIQENFNNGAQVQVIPLRDLIFPHSIPIYNVQGEYFALLLHHERTEFVG